MIYILSKLEKRAETTDTLLYFAATNRQILEKIILAIFDELYDNEIIRNINDPDPVDERTILTWCIEYMNSFNITCIPYIY